MTDPTTPTVTREGHSWLMVAFPPEVAPAVMEREAVAAVAPYLGLSERVTGTVVYDPTAPLPSGEPPAPGRVLVHTHRV